MKLLKITIFFLMLGGFFGVAMAQQLKATATGHQINLTWTASSDSTTANPGTVAIYRANAVCPTSGIGTLIYTAVTTTAPAGGPYNDTTVTAGTWCYYVTATISSATSGPSNTVQAVILPLAPSNLAIGSSE